MKKVFVIRPLEHIYDLSRPPLNMSFKHGDYPCQNVRVDQNRIVKRWGYTADRTINGTSLIQVITRYKEYDETENVLILNGEDLIARESASGKTFTYRTPRYTTGTITSITGTAVVGSGTSWDTSSNVEAGDYFIMNDDHTSDVEVDANWVKIASVTDDTHLTLESSYTKNGSAYTIRTVYSVPSGDRWQYAFIDEKFCFVNGAVNPQYWDGGAATYGTDLEATPTHTKLAKYCIEYGNRLVLADMYIDGTSQRSPWTIRWSKEGDPTDWTDSTAGSSDFLVTDDIITGLGKVGSSLIVYKENSIHVGNRTGVATSPFSFPVHRVGIGCYAPYSIVHFMGTNAFLGRSDFYIMDGDHPVPIGDRIRNKFFSLVNDTQLNNVWGTHVRKYNEIVWVADTSDGKLAFAWDYKDKEWAMYNFQDSINAISDW